MKYFSIISLFAVLVLVNYPFSLPVQVDELPGNTSISSARNTMYRGACNPPIALCKNTTIYLDPTGHDTLQVTEIDAGSSADCGFHTISVNPNIFACTSIALNDHVVTLSILDNKGDFASCMATVKVMDQTPPTAICQDLTVSLGAGGFTSVFPNDIGSQSSDACGISAMYSSPFSFSCIKLGAQQVSLTVEDKYGNTDTCISHVWVQDTTPPVANCQPDLDVYLDAQSQAVIGASEVNNNSWDACGIFTMEISDSIFHCVHVGGNIVTLSIEDSSGNIATCISTIFVHDTLAPVVSCQPLTITLGSNGIYALNTPQLLIQAIDNCGIDTWTASPNTFDCSTLGSTTVTLQATDYEGNSASCTSLVWVQDTTPPIAICQDVTAYLDFSGQANIRADDVNGGSWDACGLASVSLSDTSFTCAYVGNNTEVLTLADSSGNRATCTANVLVQDTIRPTASCHASIDVYLDSLGQGSITPVEVNDQTWDNCGIYDFSLNQSTFTCVHIGSNTVVLSAEDYDRNIATCTSTIFVHDTLAPVLTCSPFTITLGANGLYALQTFQSFGQVIDNCGIDTWTASPNTFDCSTLGSTTVTLQATDYEGNSASCTSLVWVQDTTPPIAICQDVTAYLDFSGQANIRADDVNGGSWDACGLASVSLSDTSFNCAYVGNNTETLTLADSSGNRATCTANVSVQDTIRPTASCHASIDVYLDSLGQGSITPVEVNDQTWDNCGIYDFSLNQSTFTCVHIGSNTVVLSAEDYDRNIATCTSTIFVHDTLAPVLICSPFTITLGANGLYALQTLQSFGQVIDNCGIDTWTASPNTFDCSTLGSTTVTLQATDYEGNSASCTSLVWVQDTTPPIAICQDVTAYLDFSGQANIRADDVNGGSWDACGLASVSLSDTSFTCAYVGNNTETLTLADSSGNRATCTANVSVQDTIRPTASCHASIDVYLDSLGQGSITPVEVNDQTWDNCGIYDFSLNQSTFTCVHIGSNTVVLSAEDYDRNIATCTSVIFVHDTLAPVLICSPFTITLGANGLYALQTLQSFGQVIDNCGIDTWTASPNTFDCSTLGSTTVTLQATDYEGNSASCTSLVWVQDTTPPIAICQDVTAYLDFSGQANIRADDVNGGSWDACGLASVSLSDTSFTCAYVGNNTEVLTLADSSGNRATCTANVLVQDTIRPTVICQDVTINLTSNGTYTLDPLTVDSGSSDACGLNNLHLSVSQFDTTLLGNQVVSLTGSDYNFNTSTCTANILVKDYVQVDTLAEQGCNGCGHIQIVYCQYDPAPINLNAFIDGTSSLNPNYIANNGLYWYDDDNGSLGLVHQGTGQEPLPPSMQLAPFSISYWLAQVDAQSGTIGDPIRVQVDVLKNSKLFFHPPPPLCEGTQIDLATWVGDSNLVAGKYHFYAGPAITPANWIGSVSATNGKVDAGQSVWVPLTAGNHTFWVEASNYSANFSLSCYHSANLVISVEAVSQAGAHTLLSVSASDPEVDLFNKMNGNPDPGGFWEGPSPTYHGDRGTFNPNFMQAGMYTYHVVNPPGCLDSLAMATMTMNVIPTMAPKVQAKIFLEGVLDTANCLMVDSLRRKGLVPTEEPYSQLGYSHVNGGGQEAFSPGQLDTLGDNALVDWLYMELRPISDSSHIAASRSVLLQRDGDIVDLDGQSPISFNRLPSGFYYVVIGHRNHLSVMTRLPVFLDEQGLTLLDFSQDSLLAYGSIPQNRYSACSGTMYTMIGGDAEMNGQIQNSDDVSFWIPSVGGSGYRRADYDCDGQVQNNDRVLIWSPNVGKGTQVPLRSN